MRCAISAFLAGASVLGALVLSGVAGAADYGPYINSQTLLRSCVLGSDGSNNGCDYDVGGMTRRDAQRARVQEDHTYFIDTENNGWAFSIGESCPNPDYPHYGEHPDGVMRSSPSHLVATVCFAQAPAPSCSLDEPYTYTGYSYADFDGSLFDPSSGFPYCGSNYCIHEKVNDNGVSFDIRATTTDCAVPNPPDLSGGGDDGGEGCDPDTEDCSGDGGDGGDDGGGDGGDDGGGECDPETEDCSGSGEGDGQGDGEGDGGDGGTGGDGDGTCDPDTEDCGGEGDGDGEGDGTCDPETEECCDPETEQCDDGGQCELLPDGTLPPECGLDLGEKTDGESWWESEYENGFQGVWEKHRESFMQSSTVAWLNSWSFSDSGSCPAFRITLLNGWGGDLLPSSYCWVFGAIKAILILTACFTARKLIFGG